MAGTELSKYPLIIPAAGKSLRMGMPKGLLDCGDHTWLEEQLSRFERAGGRKAVVVLGFGADQYLEHLPKIRKKLTGFDLTWTNNSNPDFGPFTSIQTAALELGPTPAFVLPIDVPAPRPQTWATLAGHLKEGVDAVVPEVGGHGGHPVLLSAKFLSSLIPLRFDSPDSRLDTQIHALPPRQVARVHVDDPAVRTDINTPEAWKAYKLQYLTH